MTIRNTNSIVYKFSISLTIILVILFSVLILSNVYSLEVVQNQMLSNSRNTLTIYERNIHNSLNVFSKDLNEVFENNIDSAMEYPQLNASNQYFKSLQLANALKAKMSNAYSADAMFIKLSDVDPVIVEFGTRVDSGENISVSDFLEHHKFELNPNGKIDEWTDFEIGEVHYLFKYITYQNISFGVLVKATTLLPAVDSEEDHLNHYVLSDWSGRILSSTGGSLVPSHSAWTIERLNKQYKDSSLFISEPIAEFGDITNIVAKQSVFSGLKLIQWIIVFLGVASLIVVPIVLRILARDILKPILDLAKASKEVEKGNWDYQIPSGHYSMEFTKLFHSFQSMVHEITNLKIHTYEERIERSRAELKYLQMQIRPHFFLNAISTITSLTYQNKNEEIRMLIQRLSEHLRYMFREGVNLIPVHEEIRYVENYILMQEIRYPDQIFFMTDIDSEAGQVQIPQFMVLTFIENIFKHALVYGKMLSIFVRVSTDLLDQKPCVKIEIEDNGEGFPPAMLQDAGMPDSAPVSSSDQVGVANIRKTLELLYKRNDLLQLSNVDTSGARIELRVPVQDRSETNSGRE